MGWVARWGRAWRRRDARTFAVAPFICVLTVGQGAGEAPRKLFATPWGSPVTASASEPEGPGDTDRLRRLRAEREARARPPGPGAARRPVQRRCGAAATAATSSEIGCSDIGLRGQNFQLAWYRDCAYVSTIGIQAVTGAARRARPRARRDRRHRRLRPDRATAHRHRQEPGREEQPRGDRGEPEARPAGDHRGRAGRPVHRGLRRRDDCAIRSSSAATTPGSRSSTGCGSPRTAARSTRPTPSASPASVR